MRSIRDKRPPRMNEMPPPGRIYPQQLSSRRRHKIPGSDFMGVWLLLWAIFGGLLLGTGVIPDEYLGEAFIGVLMIGFVAGFMMKISGQQEIDDANRRK